MAFGLRLGAWWAAALLMCVGVACAETATAPAPGPWRTSADGEDARLMLEGHDAVAYFTQGAAVRGDVAWKVEFQGVTWRFSSAANRAEFVKAPERYMPQFGGFCANGINYAVPWGGGGGPDTWRIYRGKLYVFGGRSARDHFEMDTERNLELAHRYWSDEVAGSNAFLTRVRRLIFRVPHYRSDRSLADEWESRRVAGTLPVMPGAPQGVPAR